MVMGFKLSRKRKKKYQKDNPFYGAHWKNADNDFYRKCNWEWFYFRRRVEIRSMIVIIEYPKVASKESLYKWYNERYPGDKQAQEIIRTLNMDKKYYDITYQGTAKCGSISTWRDVIDQDPEEWINRS